MPAPSAISAVDAALEWHLCALSPILARLEESCLLLLYTVVPVIWLGYAVRARCFAATPPRSGAGLSAGSRGCTSFGMFASLLIGASIGGLRLGPASSFCLGGGGLHVRARQAAGLYVKTSQNVPPLEALRSRAYGFYVVGLPKSAPTLAANH